MVDSPPAVHAHLKSAITALGIGQIISWGSLYYTVAVLGDSMRRDLKVPEAMFFGVFTVSLLLSGLAAPAIGRAIDHRGGRLILAFGSLLAGASLLLLATATGPLTLALAWSVAGVAMAACLYDPAFITLNQIAGPAYRKAVTALTLFGGFASTVFWPLTQVLLDTIGWRQTLAVYAALQWLVCLPLHVFFVPRFRTPSPTPMPPPSDAALLPAATVPVLKPGFAWLAGSFALSAFVFSVMSVYLISMLRASGLSAGDAVMVASLIGPMQVVGRILEITFARHIRPIQVGSISLLLMIMALGALFFTQGLSPLACLFAALYGFGAGMMTIVRGTVPAELYGRDGYGELLGNLARPSFISKAIAPLAFSVAASAGLIGQNATLALLATVALSMLTYQIAVRRAALSTQAQQLP